MIRAQVLVCGGTGCTSSGSSKIQEAFQENIKAFGLENEVKLVQTGYDHVADHALITCLIMN